MGHFLIIRHDLSLPCFKHSEWRISLQFFAGNLLLPCGIAFIIVEFLPNIEYSSESVCMCVCSVFLHDNSKSNRSSNMKLEYIVVQVRYWALPDQGQGHSATLKFFSILAIQIVRFHNSTWYILGS